MQKSADHAVIAQDDPHKAIFGCKEHSFHKFAATIDRLATGQLLAADSSCSGKHHPEPTSFTAVCISAGFTYTATSIQSFCSAGLLVLNPASNLRLVNLEGAQGLTDEMVYAFEADFRAKHRNGAERRLALQLPSCWETKNTWHHTLHLQYPVSRYPAVKTKSYWVCLSSPAKPGWDYKMKDAHLRKRCTPSRAERMRNTTGTPVEKEQRFKSNISLGQYMFETCKISTTIHAKPLLSFREHVDTYLADLERERG